ncbi:MAG: divalent-cation tolerance protein CutA [Halothiobacillaceae bacterium]|nr:divalent-cation tolerance protein CutA [Halothiobacillaceae bacterium]MDY0049866.1 divalent-cation tolerance protein CutA [Halothiobacillaceae bacterium]
MESEHILVLCTYPDRETAKVAARRLLDARLCACINLTGPFTSLYRWKGELREDDEVQLTIKTRADRRDALAHALREAHPYELPEILVLPVSGSEEYLQWIDSCVE